MYKKRTNIQNTRSYTLAFSSQAMIDEVRASLLFLPIFGGVGARLTFMISVFASEDSPVVIVESIAVMVMAEEETGKVVAVVAAAELIDSAGFVGRIMLLETVVKGKERRQIKASSVALAPLTCLGTLNIPLPLLAPLLIYTALRSLNQGKIPIPVHLSVNTTYIAFVTTTTRPRLGLSWPISP